MRPNKESEHLRISRSLTLAAAHLAGEIQLCVGASGCYRSFGGERKLANVLHLVERTFLPVSHWIDPVENNSHDAPVPFCLEF